jgi:DegV family protein with EDD domain
MKDFVIVIDTNSDIPYEYAKGNKIPVFQMPYTIDGKEELYDLGENTDFEEFFTKLKNGSKAFTSTRSPYDIEQFFRAQLKKGTDILYIGFSSNLSAHFGLCESAKEILQKEFPDRKIVMIDTLRISSPLALLIMEAVDMKKDGKSLEEIAKWLEKNKLRAQGWFSVDDLMYLKRGGRLSGAAAAFGTLLEVKPILILDDEGKISVHEKIKGKKKVVKYLENEVEENIGKPSKSNIVILHADSLDMATSLEAKLKEKNSYKKLWIQDIGPVIGCHTGPGVLAVCFIKKA